MSDWKGWHGGECPVDKESIVQVKCKNDSVYKSKAGYLNWRDRMFPGAIIAYRLHETDSQRIDRLERELEQERSRRKFAQSRWESCLNRINEMWQERVEPKKWTPKYGNYTILTTGEITNNESVPFSRDWGLQRSSIKLAEKARDAMRIHNRALAYVHEHAPDWDGSEPFAVWYDDERREYRTIDAYSPDIGSVTGPKWVMQKLADELNAGRVEL